MLKQANLIEIFYYDNRGRRKVLNKQTATEDFKELCLRGKFDSSRYLFGHYVTSEDYHVITVLLAMYNFDSNSFVLVVRTNNDI